MQALKLSSYPIPHQYESPVSLTRRLISLSGYRSLSEMERRAAASYNRSLYAHTFGTSKLCNILKQNKELQKEGFDIAYLKTIGLTRRNNCVIYDTKIPVRLIEKKQLKVCSQCLDDSHYSHVAHFNFLDYCPVHCRSLLECCDSCGASIQWFDLFNNKCKCGRSYSSIKCKKVESQYSKVYLEKLEGQDSLFYSNLALLMKELHHQKLVNIDNRRRLLDIIVCLLTDASKGVSEYIDFSSQVYELSLLRIILSPLAVCGIPNIEKISLALIAEPCSTPKLTTIKNRESTYENEVLPVTSKQVSFSMGVSTGFLTKIKKHELSRTLTIKGGNWSASKIESVFSSIIATRPLSKSNREQRIFPLIGGPINFFSLIDTYGIENLPVKKIDLRYGFPGVSLSYPPPSTNTHEKDVLLSVNKVASILETYPEAIRRSARAGFLNAKPRKNRVSPYLFDQSQVGKFKAKYVFITELSSTLKQPRTFLSTRLRSLNIVAVSGPTVDGSLIPVYLRKDTSNVHKHDLDVLTDIPTTTGRKQKGFEKYDSSQWARTQEICLHFDISPLSVSKMEKDKLLERGYPEGRERDNLRYYSQESVKKLKRMIQKSIPLDDFSSIINKPKKYIQRVFISTNYCKPIIVGKSKYFQRKDVTCAKDFLENYMITSDAATLLKTDSTYFSNLHKLGNINFVTESECSIAKYLRVLRKVEVNKLLET